MTGSEHNKLKHLRSSLQTLMQIRSEIKTSGCRIAIRKIDSDHCVNFFALEVFHAVNKGLVKIEYKSFCDPRFFVSWKGHSSLPNFISRRLFQVELNVLQRLESLYKMHFVSITLKKLYYFIGVLFLLLLLY